MRISLLIPTYNEARRIGSLLTEIRGIIASDHRNEWSVVIIDANSPDGTADCVERIRAAWRSVHLLREPRKRGIALAYVLGIEYAKALQADAFVEFDGDGQHNPHDLLRLVAELASGADLVIGSRYIRGGSIPREWELYRKLLSYGGSLFGRLILELPVHDVTSGLKATSLLTEAAKHLPLDEQQLLSHNYAYKIQFLHALAAHNARIVEIPISFRLREFDISKSTWRDIIESLKVVGILRLRTLSSWRFFRVLAVGLTGFVLQAAIFETIGIYFHVTSASNAVLIGAEIAVLSNFFLNEQFSFRDAQHDTSLFRRLLRFHIVSLASVAIQWAFVFVAEMVSRSPGPLLQLAYFVGVGVGFITNYLGYYFWVWRPKKQH